MLRGARIDAETHAAPELPLWEKLVAHGAFGGMAALTRLPLGPMLACRRQRARCSLKICPAVGASNSTVLMAPSFKRDVRSVCRRQ